MDVATYYAKQAVAYDSSGHFQAAEYFYLEAARSLTELINKGEASPGLSRTVQKYIERAAKLREQDESVQPEQHKSQEQSNEEKIQFILAQGLAKDEAGSHQEALDLYTQGIEFCLECVKTVPNPDLKTRFQKLATAALDRAEAIKKILDKHNLPEFPDVPSDDFESLDIDRNEASEPSVKQPLSPVAKKDSLKPEELNLLAITSKINRLSIVPFLNHDLKEKFAYVISYSDPDGLLALSDKQKAKFRGWLRPSEFSEEPVVIAKVDSGTIKQNFVSDCSFVASLAVSARYERRFKKPLITNIIYPQNKRGEPVYNPCGKYMVKLYLNGILRKVLIDDRLPMGDNGQFLCSYSQNKNELWVQLLEKAYMKVMGGYDFPGSNSNIDLNALTGWIPERVPLKSENEPVDKDALFEKLFQRFHQGHCLITLATGKMAESEQDRSGLVDAHAYACLDLRKFENKKLLMLKNPWTHLRWRGRYSEKDLKSWTPEMCKALNYNPKDAQQFDDGVFWIDIESVCHFFDVFYVNWSPALFPFNYVIHSCWHAGQGPVKDLYTISDNPQYSLEVDNKLGTASVWILLSRHIVDKEDFEHNKEYITLIVYETGKRIHLPSHPKPLLEGARINSPHYLCQLKVTNVGLQKFTLVVAQYEKSNTIYYTLRLYSTAPFFCREIPEFKNKKTISGEWKGRTAGGCGNGPSAETVKNNPIFHVEIEDGSDENSLIVDLRGPKQYSVGFKISQVSSHRNIPFKECFSGDFRAGCTVLELQSLPSGTYALMPMTFVHGQEGPFLIKLQANRSFRTKRVQ